MKWKSRQHLLLNLPQWPPWYLEGGSREDFHVSAPPPEAVPKKQALTLQYLNFLFTLESVYFSLSLHYSAVIPLSSSSPPPVIDAVCLQCLPCASNASRPLLDNPLRELHIVGIAPPHAPCLSDTEGIPNPSTASGIIFCHRGRASLIGR